MPILTKKTALAKSRKTIIVDESDESQVVIRAVPMEEMLPLFTGEDSSLKELTALDETARESAINKMVVEGKVKLGMVRSVVLLAVVEPKLHDGPTDNEDLVDVDDLSRFHMRIFQEAMEFSGLGEGRDARAFRPDDASTSGSSGGGSVRREAKRAARSSEGQPRLAPAV